MLGSRTQAPRQAGRIALVGLLALLVAGAAMAAAGRHSAQKSAPAKPYAVDIAKHSGLKLHTQTWSADVVDYNSDGWKDVFIVRHRFHPAQLYRNDHGRFKKVHSAPFPTAKEDGLDRHDCAWADVDRNHLLDIFCSIGGRRGHGTKANELWIQSSPGVFANEAEDWGVDDPYGRGRFATFLDVNRDGWKDLYVSNFYPRSDNIPSPNVLFINEAGGGFRRATEYGVEAEVGGTSVQAADLNHDGWKDLVVCGRQGVRVYENVGGTSFDDVTASLGVARGCAFTLVADFDGDRKLDLAILGRSELEVRLQRQGRFRRPIFKRKVTNGRSLASGRFNGDRFRDLYVLTGSEKRNNADLLLISKHNGRDFPRRSAATTTAGVADQVIAIDSDRDGRTEFLTLNGRGKSHGPIQLLTKR